MIKTCLAAGAAFALLLAPAAQAQTATRAWVSGHGTDAAGCGAPTEPCRSLQYAHDHIVAAGGEIDVLDPAGYGAILITKAISIINDGVGTAGVQATSADAITVDAPSSASVTLRGLSIEGVGAEGGVVFVAGATLRMLDCTIKGFSVVDVAFGPSEQARLFISNTRLFDSGMYGLDVDPGVTNGTPTVQVVLVRDELDGNPIDLNFDGLGDESGVKLAGTVTDSVFTNASSNCVVANTSGGEAYLLVSNSTFANCGVAVSALGAAEVDLAHSTVSASARAFTTTEEGVIGSFGDNAVNLNAAAGSALTSVSSQ